MSGMQTQETPQDTREISPEQLRAWRAFYPDWRDPFCAPAGLYKPQEDSADQTTLEALQRVLVADREARNG